MARLLDLSNKKHIKVGLFIKFKMKFITLKGKKFLIWIILIIVLFIFLSFTYLDKKTSTIPKTGLTIVLDPGHGGIDGGSVGTNTSVKESDLNLDIALKTKSFLEKLGVSCILTRKDENGLYKIFGRGYKQEDMNARREIIEKADADGVISIHQNSFVESSARGINAYYAEGSEAGETFARDVLSCLNLQVENVKTLPKVGDFYMVNCTTAPSILVECGYLSNPSDEALLISEAYQNKLAYAIACGVLKFFNINYY